MSDELKPCPFCENASYEVAGGIRGSCRVVCGNSDCGARTQNFLTKEDAIAAWNRRAQPEGAATTGADVTDEMVEAACNKHHGDDWVMNSERAVNDRIRNSMRAALAAALKARTG